MYDELIKRLWECVSGECWNCSQHKDSYDGQRTCADNLMKQAADAIEELIRKEKFHEFLWNTIQPNEMEQYISMYNSGNIPQKPPKEESYGV